MSLPALPGICAALPWPVAVAGVLCYVGSVYAAARGIAYLGRRRMIRHHGQMGRWPTVLTAAVHVYLLAGLAALLTAGWARLISETLRLEAIPLAGEAMAVGPFIAALLAYWWAMYPLDRALRQQNIQAMVLSGEPVPPVWTRRQFMGFNLRHNLLFLAVPVGLIILVMDVMQLAEPVLGAGISAPVGLVAIGGIFFFAPTMIVRIWRTSPLPAGPLRNRLEQLSRQAGFTCRDILVWNTVGMIINAAVLGVVRPVRYVLLSDAMLEHFDDDGVAAIFAHEAGHIVHRHIPYIVLFLVGLITLIVSVFVLSVAWLDLSSPVTISLAISATVVLCLWLFGILSRQFERQADVFAAAVATDDTNAKLTDEGIARFSDALLKVGRLNGISPDRWNLRHGSIAHRLEYLRRLGQSDAGCSTVKRSARRIKIAIWLLALFAAFSVGATVLAQVKSTSF
ncbi:MAG: M48 family metallopeptidase [Planctomycetota bacterium]|nr:M48 family metallopeptidase [Planctomycetota bacterium]